MTEDVEHTTTFRLAVAPAESMHVSVHGAGTDVVLIPGLYGGENGFRRIIAALTDAGYRAIMIEPLGIGRASRPEGASYTLESQAARVAAVLDSLRVDRAYVVAHSVGNSVALRLALARPDAVAGIVSIEGGVAESAGVPGLKRALDIASALGRVGLRGVMAGRLRNWLHESTGDPSWLTEETLRGFTAPLRDDYHALIRTYRAMAVVQDTAQLAPRLADVRVPVTLLLGGAPHEGGVPREQVDVMCRALTTLQIQTVPGAGHWIHEEQPDVVVRELTALRASRDSTPPLEQLRGCESGSLAVPVRRQLPALAW